jgi:hypothetical protein
MRKEIAMPKRVRVDVSLEGSFKYLDEKNVPAERVKVTQGDDLSWNVRLDGRPTAFQITFKNLSPFDKIKEIRSDGGLTNPEKVTTKHAGRAMSYTVTLPNGWSNDPEARVEEAGGESGTNATPDPAPIEIDPLSGVIILPASTTVARKGWVRWQSASGTFKVTFTAPSPFGTAELYSESNGILESQILKTATLGDHPYTVTMTGSGVPGTGNSQLHVDAT